jgi:hypothetical protein
MSEKPMFDVTIEIKTPSGEQVIIKRKCWAIEVESDAKYTFDGDFRWEGPTTERITLEGVRRLKEETGAES